MLPRRRSRAIISGGGVTILLGGLVLFVLSWNVGVMIGTTTFEQTQRIEDNDKKKNTGHIRGGGGGGFALQQGELMIHTPSDDVKKFPRTLVGIFSRDDADGVRQRKHYRTMIFEMTKEGGSGLNHTRICSLPQFWNKTQKGRQRLEQDECILVYTFVIGAHPNATTSSSTTIPTEINVTKPTDKIVMEHIVNPYSDDVNLPDVTRLNIRENDHEGKSQSFFYYAYQHVMGGGGGDDDDMDSPLLEYCMKVGPNTLFSLDRFLQFALEELHPAPFHRGVMAGVLRDKGYGTGMSTSEDGEPSTKSKGPPRRDQARLESYWGKEFDGVHLYMSGQLYLLSYDLIAFILTEVPLSRERVGPGGYVIGHDGHDIASMAFQSPTPLRFITISKSQQFWIYPMRNNEDDWERMVVNEIQ